MKKYISNKEKAEILAIRDAHVLSLLQTKTPAQIIKVYPNLSVYQIGKIVGKSIYEFQQKKAKDERKNATTVNDEFYN